MEIKKFPAINVDYSKKNTIVFKDGKGSRKS